MTSSLALTGPFRAFAGNAMMAARQAAAAAAAALGSGSAGCAVLLLPETCELPGWGSCVVRLQAFNNLPGTYVDTLFVQVGVTVMVGDLTRLGFPFVLLAEPESPVYVCKPQIKRNSQPRAIVQSPHQVLTKKLFNCVSVCPSHLPVTRPCMPGRVQVGDLHPQQIPVTLQVVGTPLVLSKHRVQRPASEVLHSLMHHQHQHVPALLPADGSSGTQHGADLTAGTCSSVSGGDNASCSSSGGGNSSSQEGREACKLDFGIIPAGLEVQRTVFVSNTGVHLIACRVGGHSLRIKKNWCMDCLLSFQQGSSSVAAVVHLGLECGARLPTQLLDGCCVV
jgi:hypothetical protein